MFGHKLCAAEKDPIIVGIDTSNTLLHESCALPHAKKSYGEICGLEVSAGVILFAALQYLASLWISERLKTSLQKEHSRFLENLKWDIKVREQAVRVAEYLALARNLKEDSTDTDYRKANQLSWELAMWLPEDIYKEMVSAIATPNEKTNVLSTVVSVRKLLLQKEAGDLTPENIAHHAPGIGKSRGN